MGFFDKDEKVEEILNVNVEVKTNKGNIRTICFKDFKKSIDNSISIHKDDSKAPQYDIIIKLNCNGYDVGIDGWIPVEDHLPDTDDDVYITVRSKIDGELSVHISSYCEVVFGGQKMGYKRWSSPWLYFDDNNEIIAWKPYRKPEPYNQKEIMEVSNEKIQRKV